MMSKHSNRLQGKVWHDYRRKHKLVLISIYKSLRGNYRADMIVTDENNKKIHHYLNDIEAKRFEQSEYSKNHRVEDLQVLFDNKDV